MLSFIDRHLISIWQEFRKPAGEEMVRPSKRKPSVQKEFEAFLYLFEKIMLKRNLKKSTPGEHNM